MKSILNEDNFELHIDIAGNEWQQGDVIKGVLKVVNKKNVILPKCSQTLILAHADQKKLKALADDSFTILEKINLDIPEIKPQGFEAKEWAFKLEDNFFITDKKFSPYIFFGDVSKKIPPSLMLNVTPHQSVKKILEAWELFFRFKIKDIMSQSDHSLEVKLVPPPTRELATLDSLKLNLKRGKGDIAIELTAKLKSIAADTTGMKLNFTDKKITALWLEKKYLLMPGHLNLDFVQSEIKNLIALVMTKNKD